MGTTYYRQCRLMKKGCQDEVAFIPDKFAKKGIVLEIQGSDGWKVGAIGCRMTQEAAMKMSHEHASYRLQIDN